ncbi:hypothetical protein C8P63_14912 [Melghirimyces profundicolus]|uniref:HTH cro/C1-type domain-containing protein n=1 Tax=Melghirimyces profundicolus TaxID=1242148 RepID=A0A2T6AVM3_9BACL|nr:helix-turn-helix transcriptional regulator [Melghirimyces profundicolus]PTX47847.1 hypothetical protein C8P63_14912 [Melghirimyces profundicolus]
MNPIKQIRKEKGMTLTQLAIACGKSYTWAWCAEQGVPAKVGPAMRQVLAGWGYDPNQVNREYQAWRRDQMKALGNAQ